MEETTTGLPVGTAFAPRSLRESKEGGSKQSGLPKLSPSFRSGAASHTHLEETVPNQPYQNWGVVGGAMLPSAFVKSPCALDGAGEGSGLTTPR